MPVRVKSLRSIFLCLKTSRKTHISFFCIQRNCIQAHRFIIINRRKSLILWYYSSSLFPASCYFSVLLLRVSFEEFLHSFLFSLFFWKEVIQKLYNGLWNWFLALGENIIPQHFMILKKFTSKYIKMHFWHSSNNTIFTYDHNLFLSQHAFDSL